MNDREQRSRRLLIGSLGALLLMVAFFSYQQLSAAHARAMEADENLADCMGMVEDVERVRDRPRMVAMSASSDAEVDTLASEALREIDMSDALEQIEDGSESRLGKSQYIARATRIRLMEVEIREVLELTMLLEAKGAGFRVRDVVLSRPSEVEPSEEVWNADIVLTQTVFSPKTR